jgi:hypothetical protein
VAVSFASYTNSLPNMVCIYTNNGAGASDSNSTILRVEKEAGMRELMRERRVSHCCE